MRGSSIGIAGAMVVLVVPSYTLGDVWLFQFDCLCVFMILVTVYFFLAVLGVSMLYNDEDSLLTARVVQFSLGLGFGG